MTVFIYSSESIIDENVFATLLAFESKKSLVSGSLS